MATPGCCFLLLKKNAMPHASSANTTTTPMALLCLLVYVGAASGRLVSAVLELVSLAVGLDDIAVDFVTLLAVMASNLHYCPEVSSLVRCRSSVPEKTSRCIFGPVKLLVSW